MPFHPFQQRGLGVDIASAKPDEAAANFPVSPDVCLIWKLKNMASIKVALESGVFPDSGRTPKRLWAGTFTNSQGVRKAGVGLNPRGH